MSRYYTTSFHYSAKPYRHAFRPSYGYMVIAIIVLIMSWESHQMDAALAAGDIPSEAIRLRILANSDSASDQMVKRVVRDKVVEAMNGWAAGQQSIEEARETIQSKLPELQAIVKDVLASRGFEYTSSAQLGLVEFPTKMYGNKVYPAGQYESLLITIGEGKGQNWWCVLFPPLCFVDAATGEASAAADAPVQADANSAGGAVKAGETVSGHETAEGQASQTEKSAEAPKAKFFIWEMLEKLIDWIKSLF